MGKGLRLPHRDGKGEVGFGPARADKGGHGNRLCASLARGASRGEKRVGVLKAIIPSRETNDTNHTDAQFRPKIAPISHDAIGNRVPSRTPTSQTSAATWVRHALNQ